MASSTIKETLLTDNMFVVVTYSFAANDDIQTHNKEGYFPICPCATYTGGGRNGVQVDIWNPSIGQVSFRVLSPSSGAVSILWCKCS